MAASARAATPVRPWRGVSAGERTARRRERLLEAGLEVFAARGYARSTVRDVCREAGLTERYFYESFSDREALLKALADRIVDDFLAAVAPGVAQITVDPPAAIHDGVRAFVASLADDPRRARLLLVETVGVSPAAEDHRREVIGQLLAFLRVAARDAFGREAQDSPEVELVGRALIGASNELLVAYVRGELGVGREELVATLSQLFMNAVPVVASLLGPRT